MFDLEKALATWRHVHARRRVFSVEDLDELERHLRDHTAQLVAGGLSREEAFREAMRALGDLEGGAVEYRKVRWGKLKRQRHLSTELSWSASMLKNYGLIALRTLRRQWVYSFINVFGLAVGLACFILILLFVQHERSYDRFYENADRIYRMVKRHPGQTFHGLDAWAVTPAQVPAALVEAFPDVAVATTVDDQRALLSSGDRSTWEQGLWADARFFDVFPLPLLQGNPATALTAPDGIILTESLARRLFGDDDPMGQTLLYEQQRAYTVRGVLPDLPEPSSLRYTFITSIQSQDDYLKNLAENTWNSNFYTFFVLAEGASAARLQARMPAFVETYVPDEGEDPETRVQYLIQPLSDLHLRSNFIGEIAFTGNITYVYLFSALGFVILLLACVNYTNLAVARSIKRAREVGLRKAVGAHRGQLIGQFLGESVLMAFLALGLAIVFVHALLPLFGHLVDRPIRMDYLGNGALVPGLLALTVLVGLLSGSYPAFFMASLRPLQALVGKAEGRPGRYRLQRLLIVGQYAISIALVAGSLVVHEQMRFVQTKDIGYDREQVVTVTVRDEALRRNYPQIREEWLRDPRIFAVTSSEDLPTHVQSLNGIRVLDGSRAGDHMEVYVTYGNYDFLDVFGIDLVAGRPFSREMTTDTLGAALVNETAALAFGWTPDEALGKRFVHSGIERTIVGVVQDFHMHAMHMPIEPLAIPLQPDAMGYISARVRPDDLPGTIALIERTVEQVSPYPFEYRFLDEHFDQLYRAELRMGETFGFFTVLALLIASLGLFGLAAFAAEQRTKEIGIRKVLGASVPGLVALLSADFVKLVAVAFVVGAPPAYFAMERWLQDFAYRIELGPGLFLLAGGLALLAAVLTVTYQAVRAARADPVKSLRYE